MNTIIFVPSITARLKYKRYCDQESARKKGDVHKIINFSSNEGYLLPNTANRILHDKLVWGEDDQALHNCLTDKHAVEGVFMHFRKSSQVQVASSSRAKLDTRNRGTMVKY